MALREAWMEQKEKTPSLDPTLNLEPSPSLVIFLLHLNFFQHQKKLGWIQKKNQTSTRFQIWSQAQAPHMFCSIRTSLSTMISSDGTQKQKKSTLNPAPNLELGPRSALFLLHTSFF